MRTYVNNLKIKSTFVRTHRMFPRQEFMIEFSINFLMSGGNKRPGEPKQSCRFI